MMKLVFSLLVLMIATGCMSLQGRDSVVREEDGAIRAQGVYNEDKDLDSFRVGDADGPKVTATEFESIPLEVNEQVEKWINYFQGRGRPHMERYLSRSTRYEKLMKKVLKDNGLPEDLFYIALIESGFSSRATSHASAVGYWQFIRGTGKRYRLEINQFVDERRDPVLATQAAADYFRDLYTMFDSWYLAMASYNVGENRVKREVRNHNTRDFWELHRKRRLPRETMNYVPKFLAAKMIGTDPAKYGFADVDYMPPIEFDHIYIDKAVNLRVMAEKMNYNYEDFKALNPKFKGEVAPLKKDTLSLRIPPGMNTIALAAASESVVENIQFVADSGDTETYRIRRGDTLSGIAQRYRTTVAFLRDINELPKKKILKVGMRIQVPDRTPVSNKRPVVKKAVATKSKKLSGPFYIVQNGDNLTLIAQRYSTTVSELMRLNKMRRGSLIKSGSRLRVPSSEVDESSAPEVESKQSDKSSKRSVASQKAIARSHTKKVHVVESGENLSVIASKYQMSVEELKELNDLDSSKLFVGAKLNIVKDKSSKVHVVKRGENLSRIASKYQVTVAGLKEMNNLESSKLLVGSRLVIPD